MTSVNQRVEPVFEEYLYAHSSLDTNELQIILFEMLSKMNWYAVRTNATKHGNTEIVIHKGE
jgi:hypothetical protein